jgi:hypothetical protein
MARSIINKPNTDGISGDYPFGKIKDKTISAPGTPVNTVVYGDFHQFFAKLMDYAGVTPNELPDNEYSGWQLMESLLKIGAEMRTKVVQIGSWNMDSVNQINVTHGIADETTIRSIEVNVYNDLGAMYPINFCDGVTAAGLTAGSHNLDGANVTLRRFGSGVFDDPAFSSTGINRGFIVIKYVDPV